MSVSLAATRRVLVGLGACSILFGSLSVLSEASPLQQTAPTLGAAASFAVLGASTVTNTGSSTINADLGVSPGSAATGFPPGTVVGGTIHTADALAASAQADTTAAYNSLAGQTCTRTLTGTDLGGLTLVPGVYCFADSAQLTGVLTLNALGSGSSVFVFKIGSTLTTASNSSVVMINPGSPCNVFWQVGSSATLGTTTNFIGSILALTSISLTTSAKINGRALARNGAVTLDTNTVGSTACTVGLSTPVPAAATAIAAATSAAATATAAANAPAPSSPRRSTATPTLTPVPTPPTATLTPVPPATATSTTVPATATPPPATATPPPAAPAAPAAPPQTANAQAGNAAAPTGETPAGQTPNGQTPNANTSTVATAIPMTARPGPAQIPTSLPRTGAGPLPLGIVALLVGALAVALGLVTRLTRK
jgi:hypothetical protein